jgi:hypothetical protein
MSSKDTYGMARARDSIALEIRTLICTIAYRIPRHSRVRRQQGLGLIVSKLDNAMRKEKDF